MKAITADAYLLLNSDTIVRPWLIVPLLEASDKNSEAGLITPGYNGQTQVLKSAVFVIIRLLVN